MVRLRFILFCLFLGLTPAGLIARPDISYAQEKSNLGSLFREQFPDKNTNVVSRTVPREEPSTTQSSLELKGGTVVTIISPSRWNSVADGLGNSLELIHNKYAGIFGDIPAFKTSLRLMEEQTFYLSTGAPGWTNALYYKGQIMIPLADGAPVDYENLNRSVKHEYTHAVINALSGGRCPGWLDEGLAQWAEGSENPALRPALVSHLRKNSPVNMALLQNGFTRLDTKIVPAAYAQSLFATNTLINTYGIKKIGEFLGRLRKGDSRETAFLMTFRVSEPVFERDLGFALKKWARGGHTGHLH